MNQQQIQSLIASIILSTFGGVAAKYFDTATWTTLATSAATLLTIGGVAIWRIMAKTDTQIVKQAAAVIAPTGGVIQTTNDVANGSLSSVPNVVTKP